jgi:hypothetical protein
VWRADPDGHCIGRVDETSDDLPVRYFTDAVTLDTVVAYYLPVGRRAPTLAANQDAMTEGVSCATEARSISRLVMV